MEINSFEKKKTSRLKKIPNGRVYTFLKCSRENLKVDLIRIKKVSGVCNLHIQVAIHSTSPHINNKYLLLQLTSLSN